MGVIYEPKGRAGEYAALAVNLYVGCEHKCQYCYVASMPQFKLKGIDFFKTEARPRKYVLEQLRGEAPKYEGTDKRVLLCFTCDPYQPIEQSCCITQNAIKIFRQYDIPFTVLTKGGSLAARDFGLYGKNDTFGVTMTLLDRGLSKGYEPGASIPESRIISLELAKLAGIETWVSLEPVIYPEVSLEIIRRTHKFVDLYKIGIWNHQGQDQYQLSAADWRRFGQKAIALCRELKKDYFIKDDLAKYLDGISFKNVDTRKVHR